MPFETMHRVYRCRRNNEMTERAIWRRKFCKTYNWAVKLLGIGKHPKYIIIMRLEKKKLEFFNRSILLWFH